MRCPLRCPLCIASPRLDFNLWESTATSQCSIRYSPTNSHVDPVAIQKVGSTDTDTASAAIYRDFVTQSLISPEAMQLRREMDFACVWQEHCYKWHFWVFVPPRRVRPSPRSFAISTEVLNTDKIVVLPSRRSPAGSWPWPERGVHIALHGTWQMLEITCLERASLWRCEQQSSMLSDIIVRSAETPQSHVAACSTPGAEALTDTMLFKMHSIWHLTATHIYNISAAHAQYS